MTRLSRITALALALVVALTSQQMAVARGVAMSADGQVVICTGAGVTTVTLDVEGNPIGPVHICPDCALHTFAAASPFSAAETAVIHIQTLPETPAKVWQTASIHIPASARDPPLMA